MTSPAHRAAPSALSIRWRSFLLAGGSLGLMISAPAQEGGVPAPAPGLPAKVSEGNFNLLLENSPFTRSLNSSDLLILTGIADVNGKPVATLMNKETKETYVVSEQPNLQGWKMVEIARNDDLERVSAKIAIAGGEVVTVRYDEWSLKPGEARPASGGNSNIAERRPGPGSGDGRRRGGDPEIREKMMKLSEDQRNRLFSSMREKMEKNPNMSSDERREMFRKTLDSMQR